MFKMFKFKSQASQNKHKRLIVFSSRLFGHIRFYGFISFLATNLIKIKSNRENV